MNGIIILLIISTFLSFVTFYIVLSNSLKTEKNKVHFYVARDKRDKELWLYIGKPIRREDCFEANKLGICICLSCLFKDLGLNENNYKDLKWEDEPKEVFLNMED